MRHDQYSDDNGGKTNVSEPSPASASDSSTRNWVLVGVMLATFLIGRFVGRLNTSGHVMPCVAIDDETNQDLEVLAEPKAESMVGPLIVLATEARDRVGMRELSPENWKNTTALIVSRVEESAQELLPQLNDSLRSIIVLAEKHMQAILLMRTVSDVKGRIVDLEKRMREYFGPVWQVGFDFENVEEFENEVTKLFDAHTHWINKSRVEVETLDELGALLDHADVALHEHSKLLSSASETKRELEITRTSRMKVRAAARAKHERLLSDRRTLSAKLDLIREKIVALGEMQEAHKSERREIEDNIEQWNTEKSVITGQKDMKIAMKGRNESALVRVDSRIGLFEGMRSMLMSLASLRSDIRSKVNDDSVGVNVLSSSDTSDAEDNDSDDLVEKARKMSEAIQMQLRSVLDFAQGEDFNADEIVEQLKARLLVEWEKRNAINECIRESETDIAIMDSKITQLGVDISNGELLLPQTDPEFLLPMIKERKKEESDVGTELVGVDGDIRSAAQELSDASDKVEEIDNRLEEHARQVRNQDETRRGLELERDSRRADVASQLHIGGAVFVDLEKAHSALRVALELTGTMYELAKNSWEQISSRTPDISKDIQKIHKSAEELLVLSQRFNSAKKK